MKKIFLSCLFSTIIGSLLLFSCTDEVLQTTENVGIENSNPQKVAPATGLTISPTNLQTIKGWGVTVDQLYRPGAVQAELADLGITIGRIALDHTHCNPDGSVRVPAMDSVCYFISKLTEYNKQYILCSWSPNYSMKTNEATSGDGLLKYDKENQFVDYWLNICNYINSKGLPLPTAMVIQNEPTHGSSNYDGMGFQGQDSADFSQYYRVIKSVRQHLDSAGYTSVKLLGPEEGYCSGKKWANGLRYLGGNGFPAFNDSELRYAIDGVSAHSYYWGTPISGIADWRDACELWGKDKWMTEFCAVETKASDTDIYAFAIEASRRFCSDMVYVRDNYWFWWAASKGPWKEALIDYTNLTKLPVYYILQKIWNNIPIGSVARRVISTNPSISTIDSVNMDAAAFVTPENKTVVVVVNFTNNDITESLGGLTGDFAKVYTSTVSMNMLQTDSMSISETTINSLYLPAKSVSVIVTETKSGVNLLYNPGFEIQGSTPQILEGWITWAGTNGTDANADYREETGNTGTYHLTHWKATAYEVGTSQTVTGLQNGSYKLSARIRGDGTQTLKMIAQKIGGNSRIQTIPVTSTWTQFTIDNIIITSGECKVDFWNSSPANGWVHIDDVELVKK